MKQFFEVDFAQVNKDGMMICGDVFLQKKQEERNRILLSLSDGLGSGVKANVLANMTATMVQKYMENDIGVKEAAANIMKTLPVCSTRKISYATFTIVDIEDESRAKIVEYDNPLYILIRDGNAVQVPRTPVFLEQRFAEKQDLLLSSSFEIVDGDRLVVFSDGVSQAGMGTGRYPFGWGEDGVREYILHLAAKSPDLSATELCRSVVRRALHIDSGKSKDDISCAVLYARTPRKLMVATGPPISRKNDEIMFRKLDAFHGRKIICGGTTASIISRYLGKPVKIILESADEKVPPCSAMDGVDLVTEGIITLSAAAEYLEKRAAVPAVPKNAAFRLVSRMLKSDHIHFIVGSKINEAHQDPSMPVEIAIRRNIVRRICNALETKYLKTVVTEYI